MKRKTLEGNTASEFFDISLSNIILDGSRQAWETKAEIKKWHCIKLKCFCTAKESINKMNFLSNLEKNYHVIWQSHIWVSIPQNMKILI